MNYFLSMDLGQKQGLSQKQNQLLMMLPQMRQAISFLQLPVMELSPLIEAELEHNPVLEYMEDDSEEDEQREAGAEHDEPDGDASASQELAISDENFEVLRQLDEEYRDFFNESGQTVTSRTQEDEKKQAYLENSIPDSPTLFAYLMEQAQETFATQEELKVAEAIIGNLDDRGFLQTPLEEIALTSQTKLKNIQEVLAVIQTFEPRGIGASSLQDCLMIQLRQQNKEGTIAYLIVEKYFDDLLHNRIPTIQRNLNCSYADICDAIEQHIAKLDFRPGALLRNQEIQSIIPDLMIRAEEDKLFVDINDDSMPSLRLNRRYMRMLEDESLPVETKDYIKQNILSAKWLMRNIYQRNETLQRIGELLADKQKDFLINPEGQLIPMTMKFVAQELQLHESTIARAVSNKYIDTPRGVLPLRSFFSTTYVSAQGEDISAQTVLDAISRIIEEEDKKHPLSDEAISAKLKEQGIICARRTVAKHRQELNQGNALQRRKYS